MRHYLNLADTLSQAWLDQTVLFLVLATLKVHFFSTALISLISTLKESSMPLCRQLEVLAGELEQAPAQMSRLTASVIQTLADNFHVLVLKLVYLVAQVAKGIVSLLLEMYLGTLTCLITAAIKGTLELVSEILEDITKVIQKAVSAVLKEFNSALSGLSSVINTITTAVSAVESLFTSSDKTSVKSSINKVNLTVSSLSNITIPTTWIGDIDSLANEVPDFEDVLSNVSSLLTFPITELTENFANTSFNFTLNESFSLSNSTQVSVLPRSYFISPRDIQTNQPANSTGGMCHGIEIALTDAIAVTRSMANYIILGLCIGVVLYSVLNWILSYFRMRKRSRLYSALAGIEDSVEVGNRIANYEHGMVAIFTSKWTPELQWLYSYVTTPNMRMCLVVGLLGWFVVFLQFITLRKAAKLLRQISTDGGISPDAKAQLVDEFANYMDDAQVSLDTAVEGVNKALFSSIHNTSSAILDGIDLFQTSVNDTINVVFGSSFLASPLRTIIYCTIGRKVDTIEEGLQWIEKNTVFESPSLEKQVMEKVFEDSTPDFSDAQSKVVSNIIAAVQKLIELQQKALWKEFFIATAFVAVWVIYLLVGLAILANRKVQVFVTDNRASTQAISWPTQLCEEAQREYNYPYNDPYGVPYLGRNEYEESIVSKPHTCSSQIESVQPSPTTFSPNERSDSLPR